MTESNKPGSQVISVDLNELSEILLKYFNIHEGKYELAINFRIASGSVGPSSEQLPGFVIGCGGVGLVKTEGEDNPRIIDAAKVNPKRIKRSRSKSE